MMGSLPVHLRDSTPEDLELLRDVYRRASLSNDGDRAALLGHPETLVWSAPPESAGRVRVAVDDEGVVTGFATTLFGDDIAELDDLFVDPDRMRRGVGMRLVRDAADGARDAGFAALEVTANPAASQFYAAAGFEAAGTVATRFAAASRLRLAL